MRAVGYDMAVTLPLLGDAPIWVRAWRFPIYPGLCYFRARDIGWVVAHWSGAPIVVLSSRHRARRMIAALAPLMDWDIDFSDLRARLEADTELRRRVVRTMIEVTSSPP